MDRKNDRMIFSLKLKFSLVISFLLLTSVGFYLYYSMNEFKKDKTAYVFEANLQMNQNLLKELEKNFDSLVFLATALNEKKTGEGILDYIKGIGLKLPGLERFFAFQLQGQGEVLGFDLKSHQLIPSEDPSLKGEVEKMGRLADSLNWGESQLYLSPSLSAHIVLLVKSFDLNFAFFIKKDLFSSLSKRGLIDEFLIEKENQILVGSYPVIGNDLNRVKSLLAPSSSTGVLEFKGEKQSWLIGSSTLPRFGLKLLTFIKREKAFSVLDFLLERSLYFGLGIISLSVVIGILFTRGLTKPLGQLVESSLNMVATNFQTHLNIKSRDEIGQLAKAYNYMADEIRTYMGEMEEKARLENEIKVAQLVQESFFPNKHIETSQIEIAAFFEPATECGGDWWGQLSLGSRSIILITDVTGHGAPSALLTATAFCCLGNLKELGKYNPQMLENPAEILKFYNKAVCGVGGRLMMTGLCLVVDHELMKITYSNASHAFPFLYSPLGESPQKSHFKSLMEANSYRLGHKEEGEYTTAELLYKKNDTLVLYTDGIVEGTNQEDKPYGKRLFIKSLMTHIQKPLDLAVEEMIRDYKNYTGKEQEDDDVTLLLAKLK